MGASMFGLFVFGGVYALVIASVKGPVLASSLVMWGVLFALLGWNFMDYGVFNSTSDGAVWGWAVPGVVLWLLAMGGLVPAAAMAVRWMIHRDEPEQPMWNPPVVRAAVQTPPAGPTPRVPRPRFRQNSFSDRRVVTNDPTQPGDVVRRHKLPEGLWASS
jgi:hypothetical protein